MRHPAETVRTDRNRCAWAANRYESLVQDAKPGAREPRKDKKSKTQSPIPQGPHIRKNRAQLLISLAGCINPLAERKELQSPLPRLNAILNLVARVEHNDAAFLKPI
jgi:hypothetical protein